jgi:outer membrane protein assembly factor BamD (BamD/ComL family)
MKKFLFVQKLFVVFLLISFVTSSYGAGKFKEHYNKGIDFYKQGKYDQAGQEFKKAIELKPNDVYALYGLGNTYYCKAKYDDAVKIYTKAINISPDYAKVHYSLSLAYSKLGMTREAEKQKTMFRKLSQGGKSTGSSTHEKASHTSSHARAEHAPKKTLSHAPKKSLHEAKHTDTHAASRHETKTHDTHAASRHETKTHDTHAASGHEAKTHDTHAASGHEAKTHDTHAASGHKAKTHDTHAASGHKAKTHDTHAASKHETKTHDTHAASGHEAKTHDTHAASKHDSGGDSHSIFKGYSGETHKADERVFKKKPHGTYSFSKKPFRSVKYFIQDKWYSSGINKIWICAAGYIFGTQIWLCVVAFFCVIVWRIREKV